MKRTAKDFDLVYGFLGNGYTVFNKRREIGGDYEKVAHINHDRTAKIYVQDLPQCLVEEINRTAREADGIVHCMTCGPCSIFSVPIIHITDAAER